MIGPNERQKEGIEEELARSSGGERRRFAAAQHATMDYARASRYSRRGKIIFKRVTRFIPTSRANADDFTNSNKHFYYASLMDQNLGIDGGECGIDVVMWGGSGVREANQLAEATNAIGGRRATPWRIS
ncbi:hypothetical protein Tco_0897664 [Tanacetum coccineum]